MSTAEELLEEAEGATQYCMGRSSWVDREGHEEDCDEPEVIDTMAHAPTRNGVGELCETVHELIERVEHLNAVIGKQIDRRKELEELVDIMGERIDVLEARTDVIDAVAPDTSSKETKVAAIIRYADNKRGDRPVAFISREEIQSITGVSRRYAYQLCNEEDGLPAEYPWCHANGSIEQYGDLERDGREQRRAGLILDFEGVHGEKLPVNKFITQTGGNKGVDG